MSRRITVSPATPGGNRPQQEEVAPYLFHQGTNYQAYKYLGVHREGDRVLFRVWAPNADAVSVCGDFNDWDIGAHPMRRITQKGIWEAYLPSETIKNGQNYKYYLQNGSWSEFKADPYGVRMQQPPETASVIWDLDGYDWQDSGWMAYRNGKFDRAHVTSAPINIYELHVGSWQRRADGSYLSYTELAEELIPYVKQMGYTHVELMPLAEHPYDGSWGYQICGWFAPTARFGTPQELMFLIDRLHRAGIGVLLDWVPAHFPKDTHGLYEFDGQPLYEYQGSDRIEHRGWGTRRFDVGREEVQSFLISNAVYWIERFHVDGLRVDAVSSMLYLDYDKAPGEWIPNVYGDNRCLEAIAFFQKMNAYLAKEYPDVMTVAEESSAYPGVTTFENGGLGFSLKWNMGWMNDSLTYAATDPSERGEQHRLLNFSILYAFHEAYVLPVSHDEVVHGKRSLLDRMPGDYTAKFAGTRTYMTYQMTHPGKKLLFMGCEIGMFREWDCNDRVEWFLLDYDMHAKLQRFLADLNHLYLEQPPLWEQDGSPDSFRWIDADDAAHSVCSYRRIGRDGRELIVLLNFRPITHESFPLSVPFDGTFEELLNTDHTRYGGEGRLNDTILRTVARSATDLRPCLRLRLPALSAVILHRVPDGTPRSSTTVFPSGEQPRDSK